MNRKNSKKMVLASMLCAVAVAGSTISFPVFGSRCAPVQHIVNVLCAVLLGPWYGVLVAFVSSLIRNLLGLGTPLAFPGSMFGALLCGFLYHKSKNLPLTILAEILGTAVFGGFSAYLVAIWIMGRSSADIFYYTYLIPFLLSSTCGAVTGGVCVMLMKRNKALSQIGSFQEER